MMDFRVARLLVATTRLLMATAMVLSAPWAAAEQPPPPNSMFARRAAEVYPPVSFEGRIYDFYKNQKITNGTGLYFAPDGQDPDLAREEIIVNYFDPLDREGHAITAEQIALGMIQNFKDRGAETPLPFKTPDPADNRHFIFHIVAYYVYAQDMNGDIWMSKIAETGNKVIGILYKHQIDGRDSAAIAANIKSWLVKNLQNYGLALNAVVPPDGPRP